MSRERGSTTRSLFGDSMLEERADRLRVFRSQDALRAHEPISGGDGPNAYQPALRAQNLRVLLAAPVAEQLQACVERSLRTGQPVRDLELNAPLPADPARADACSWLINALSGEDRVEKLVAGCRRSLPRPPRSTSVPRRRCARRRSWLLLAAWPLRSRMRSTIPSRRSRIFCICCSVNHRLDEQAHEYACAAQLEIARVSEMTQQTLRFYRQSTSPAVANIAELLESAATVFQGRLYQLHAEVTEDMGPDVNLYCFSRRNLRRLFVNIIGNAVDALAPDGRIWLKVRRSRSWRDGAPGVRIFIADSGFWDDRGHPSADLRATFFTTKDSTGTSPRSLRLAMKSFISTREACASAAGRTKPPRRAESLRHRLHDVFP